MSLYILTILILCLKALVINPKYENALYNKGLALDNLGKYTGALISLDKALAIDPKDEESKKP
jgi:tetratricopeptide (TPR) repeat protein